MRPAEQAHSANGQIESVKDQVLDSMLLNELQKQAATMERLGERFWGGPAGSNSPPKTPISGAGPVEARAGEDGVEFSGPGRSRKVKLSANTLAIQQNAPLPPGGPAAHKRGSVRLQASTTNQRSCRRVATER